MKLLLVDDEPLILSALSRMLGRLRPHWEIRVVSESRGVLPMMDADPPDLIMADLDMPGLDGVALLSQVRDRHPATIRLVLSGASDPEVKLRTLPLAHQFLAKPCEADDLLRVLDAGADLLREHSPGLTDVILAMDTLPSAPPVYAALSRALAQKGTSIRDLERIVLQDPAISSRVLQIVNSAFFGLARSVESLPQAISLLGINALRSLVLTVEAFKVFDSARNCVGFSPDIQRGHALLTARVATRIAPSRDREAAFTAGLLHDVGKLVLATELPGEFGRVLQEVKAEGGTARAVERRRLGLSHGEVGERLLRLWGLPDTITRIVGRHDEPGALTDEWDAGSAVRTANVLAHAAVRLAGIEPGIPPELSEVDPVLAGLVEAAGGMERMEEIAREELGRALVEMAHAGGL